MSSEYVREFTDSNFESEVLKSSEPVLVDFWAEWCGPCKMLTPIVEDLAKEYDGKIKIGKLNVDHSPASASRYGITSIPTILFVKNGKVADQQIGLLSKNSLKGKIDQLLA
jgi:thioredoxin 1